MRRNPMTGSPVGYRHVSDQPQYWYRCDNPDCGQERPFVTYRERGHKCRECEGHMTFLRPSRLADTATGGPTPSTTEQEPA